MKEDIPYKFWKRYEKADLLEREELLKPVVKNLMSITDIKDEKMRQQLLKSCLKGYFDDLIEYFHLKR